MKSNPKKRLLTGNWLLRESKLIPTIVPSFCDSLYLGTKFNFDPDGIFEIYSKDSSKKCGSYSYRIWEDEISFVEYDMVMKFDIIKLTSDTLMLKSTFVHDNLWNEEVVEAVQNGYTLVLTKVK